MNHLLTTTAISMILTATGATAATIEEQVKTELLSRGYEEIEVQNANDRVAVAAVRNTVVLEIIYDALTGEVLVQNVEELDVEELSEADVFDLLDEDEIDEDDLEDDEDEDDDEDDEDDEDEDDDEDDEDDEDD